MNDFAQWLAGTQLSLAIQVRLWVIPTVQSIHIAGIGIVLASVFMIDLRIFGWAGRDQTLQQTTRRFCPWLWSALVVLLITGVLMVIGEPVRELMSLSFWLKMSLLLIGIVVATLFQLALRRNDPQLGRRVQQPVDDEVPRGSDSPVWCSIIVLGRLIAYDHVWGSWSLRPIV
jgi:uncharacterized membrane protein